MTHEELNNLITALLKLRESATDENAFKSISIYPIWKPNTKYTQNKDRVRFNDRLYKCRQTHTSQEIYPPDITPALFEEITIEDGTINHPIRYNNNMELFEGKYYIQNEVVYICTRSTGTAVYNPLSDLVGIYVGIAD